MTPHFVSYEELVRLNVNSLIKNNFEISTAISSMGRECSMFYNKLAQKYLRKRSHINLLQQIGYEQNCPLRY